MTDKVIFLAFSNEKMPVGERQLGSCSACKNKTFISRYDLGEYPVLVCAACGCEIGAFGWTEGKS